MVRGQEEFIFPENFNYNKPLYIKTLFDMV